MLWRREIVEVDDERFRPVRQEARHHRRGRELVDGDVPRRGVIGVRPVLVRLVGQVVVDRLGEDLRPPPGRAQDVTQQQGVRPRGVARIERRDELVDGHRRRNGGPDGRDQIVGPGGTVHHRGVVPALVK